MSSVAELTPTQTGGYRRILDTMAHPQQFRSLQGPGPHSPNGQGGYYAPEDSQMHPAQLRSQFQHQFQQQQQLPWHSQQQARGPTAPHLPPVSTLVPAAPPPAFSPRSSDHDTFRKGAIFSDYASPPTYSPCSPQVPSYYSEVSPSTRQPNAEYWPSPTSKTFAAKRKRSFEHTPVMNQIVSRQPPMGPMANAERSHLARPMGPSDGHMNLLASAQSIPPAQPFPPPRASARSLNPESIHSPRAEPRSMAITNLLSHDEAPPRAQMPPSSAATTGSMMSPPNKIHYRLTMAQQPSAARSCGFGERDRRVIDPPPILKLHAYQDVMVGGEATRRELSYEELLGHTSYEYAVVHCTILDELGHDASFMPDEYSKGNRRLMGTVANTAFVSHKPDGVFFQFSDLSCRTAGRFRLRFALVLPTPDRPICFFKDVIHSDVFQVYNAKDFPGMQASTELARRLKEQGCLISIKKGMNDRGGRRRRSNDDDSEDDWMEEADDDDFGEGKSRKKQKRSK